MNMISIKTLSPEETFEKAIEFATLLKAGDRIALQGELGAGKTCFSKGIISKIARIEKDEITSPTFTLIEEYYSEPRIYHVDLYRIDDPKQAEDLPWDDLLSQSNISIFEWPEKINNLISYCNYEIKFSKTMSESRLIEITKKDKK